MGCTGSSQVYAAETFYQAKAGEDGTTLRTFPPESTFAGSPQSSDFQAKPAASPGKSRRVSMTGGPMGSTVLKPTADSKRRRLTIIAAPAADARKIALENQVVDPNNDANCPIIRVGRSQHLPVEWVEYSRPGNDPMKRTKENQDSCCVHDTYAEETHQMFFGVFDGHGPNGAAASQFVRDYLPLACLDAGDVCTDTFKSMSIGCLQTNSQLAESDIDVYMSGSTGVSTILQHNKLFVANVGDSRVVLGRELAGAMKAIDLSSDHKPDRPDEKHRILQYGGRVYEWGVPRVWLRDIDIPGLAMSRSFGDMAAESVGVFAKPELCEATLGSEDKFVIWASDGVWEFISSQEAADIVWANYHKGPLHAAAALVKESCIRWNAEEDVVDDITCVIAFLNFTDGTESTLALEDAAVSHSP